jgi:mRNA-degrading endonuclease RelE of RelBE toxin-antitoxin system
LWARKLQRPTRQVLRGTLQFIADRPFADLLKCRHIWKQLRGLDGIYEIRKDQARIYCCRVGKDIAIVAWEQKKRNEPDKATLRRAVRVAAEVRNEYELLP